MSRTSYDQHQTGEEDNEQPRGRYGQVNHQLQFIAQTLNYLKERFYL